MTAWALRRHAVVIAVFVALAGSAPALAQTRLYLLIGGDLDWQCNPSCDQGRVIQIDVDRLTIVASTPIRHARSRAIGPRVTPDGRFLLWSGSEQPDYGPLRQPLLVSLFDIATRQQTTPFVASGTYDIAPFSVHPSEMRAFMQLSLGGQVTVAEPGHTHALPPPPCAVPFLESRSGDGRRLSYLCGSPLSMMVVDSTDGRLVGTVPHGVTAHVLDDEGATMFAVTWDFEARLEPTVYQRFDVATGALLAERTAPPFDFFASVWGYNQKTGHLYAGGGSGIRVLDATTLAEVGRIDSPHPELFPMMALDRDQPHAYIAWTGAIDGRPVVRVSLVHTGTLATLGALDVPVDSHLEGLTLGPRPPALSDLNVVVDQRVATLTWTIAASRSIATRQVVEAGFTPGATAVRLPVAAGATSLTVPGVPPGHYYVRVRSENGTGLGTPSNEVLVDVP